MHGTHIEILHKEGIRIVERFIWWKKSKMSSGSNKTLE